MAQAKKLTATKTKRKLPQPNAPLPNWPSLKPLVPATDLALETLLEDQIVVIRNFFTSTLCKTYVSFLSLLPLITTPAQPKEGDAVRVNDRIQFDDPVFAEQLWTSTALKHLVSDAAADISRDGLTSNDSKQRWSGEVCGLNPRIRIYRYGTLSFIYVICARPRH